MAARSALLPSMTKRREHSVEVSFDEALEHRQADRFVLGGPFPQAQNVLFAVLIDAECDEHDVFVDVDAVQHDDVQRQLAEVTVQQLLKLLRSQL